MVVCSSSPATDIPGSEPLDAVVRPTAEMALLAEGFKFVGGMVWSTAEDCLLVNDVVGDACYRWDAAGGVALLRRPTGKANGMAPAPDDSLLLCEHVDSRVVRRRPDGEVEVVASHYEGRQLNSPYDVVTARDGTIYFTDPTLGRTSPLGTGDRRYPRPGTAGAGAHEPPDARDPELHHQGVYAVTPDGALRLLDDTLEQPRGLSLSPAEDLLYVGDALRSDVRVLALEGGGTAARTRQFARGIGRGQLDVGTPDGLVTDAVGNVYVSGPGGLWIYAPDGERIGRIAVPWVVTGLAWGGRERSQLFIGAGGRLLRLQMAVRGAGTPA